MRQTKSPSQILEGIYNISIGEIKKDNGRSFLNGLKKGQMEWLLNIVKKCESLKAVVTALATSLTKKIENSKQDVRYHKEDLRGGYSGRTFDTKYITPFFKEKFRRLAMKESGWLTRSIEQPRPFTMKFPGKIRDREAKKSFLSILNDIEENKASPKKYLVALFILLIQQTNANPSATICFTPTKEVTIDLIITCLKSHFFKHYTVSGASRLPVIAIYSIYQLLMQDIVRYQNKKLSPSRSHTSPDMRAKGIGDIEVTDKSGKYFEGVEVKYGIPIDTTLINDAYEKFKSTPTSRYYLLSTAEPNIKEGEEQKVNNLLLLIRKEHGCEVIVNGIMATIKYYLRLLRNPAKFIEQYTNNLKLEYSQTTDIKKEHIIEWEGIINELSKMT